MKLMVRLLRWLLSFRYKVEIKGIDLLNNEQTFLIMPSHVALVDPIIIYAFLRGKVKFHLVVTRAYYDTILLKPFFKWLGAIPVSQFDKDQGGTEDAKKMIEQLSCALAHQTNILLYPQGELERQGYQSIIGKKSAFYTVQNAPKDTKCIAVTIR